MLCNTIKAKPRSPERHRKKFAWYIAEDADGKIYSAITMRTLCKAVNKKRKHADYCHSQHLYCVASERQLSPYKGLTVRRLDSEEDYERWKKDWESEGGQINL